MAIFNETPNENRQKNIPAGVGYHPQKSMEIMHRALPSQTLNIPFQDATLCEAGALLNMLGNLRWIQLKR